MATTRIIKTPYGDHPQHSINFTGSGRTKQSFKDECDINTILARYQKTGILEFVNNHSPQYGDVRGLEFQAAMEAVAKGREVFDQVPSSIRKRFDNDPGVFLAFLDDPANAEEAVRLGLVPAKVPDPSPEPAKAPEP